MKIKYRLFTLVIVAIIAVLSVTASIVIGASAAKNQPQASSSTICAYILKDHNGFLAIFKDGAPEPLRVLDVYTDILPERDREALKKGIKASSLEEILAIAEDYDG